jgi:hypothetical protein
MHFMKINKITKTVLIIVAATIFLGVQQLYAAEIPAPAATVPVTAASAKNFNYTLLESFPGFFTEGAVMTDLPKMILAIYKFGIWTIGIAGLLMITVGGIMYAGSAGNTATATKAKGIITDALIGIAAAMSAYLFLYVINPDLTNLNIKFTAVNVDIITEAADTSAESAGTLSGGKVEDGKPGSCGGLATQAGISSQCVSASTRLSNVLTCIAGKLPNAVVSSITDSKGYANCVPSKYSQPPCAHHRYSCHYGGKSCAASGKSYAVDLSTKTVTASQLISAAKTCGASYTVNEGNHVHASVGQAEGCGCN